MKKIEAQSPTYVNEWHRLRVDLLRSASWLGHEVKTFLEPWGITQKQFNILRILRGHEPDEQGLTICEIRDRMIDRMSDASRLVDRLAKKDLLRKKPCRRDGRLARVRITPKGLQLLSAIDARQEELDSITQRLDPEEASMLADLLEKMAGLND